MAEPVVLTVGQAAEDPQGACAAAALAAQFVAVMDRLGLLAEAYEEVREESVGC